MIKTVQTKCIMKMELSLKVDMKTLYTQQTIVKWKEGNNHSKEV